MSAQAAATTVPAIESDLEVLGRHLAGDERAFAELYRRFGGLVFNLAWRLSGDREEAADLTQEVFLRLFRHLPRFRGDSAPRTWVYQGRPRHCCRSLEHAAVGDGAPCAPVPRSRSVRRGRTGRSGRRCSSRSTGGWRRRSRRSPGDSAWPWCCAMSRVSPTTRSRRSSRCRPGRSGRGSPGDASGFVACWWRSHDRTSDRRPAVGLGGRRARGGGTSGSRGASRRVCALSWASPISVDWRWLPVASRRPPHRPSSGVTVLRTASADAPLASSTCIGCREERSQSCRPWRWGSRSSRPWPRRWSGSPSRARRERSPLGGAATGRTGGSGR